MPELNMRSKVILVSGGCLVVLMLLFPPFVRGVPIKGDFIEGGDLGYHWIFNPPTADPFLRALYELGRTGLIEVESSGVAPMESHEVARINFPRLAVQLLALLFAWGVAFVMVGPADKSDRSP